MAFYSVDEVLAQIWGLFGHKVTLLLALLSESMYECGWCLFEWVIVVRMSTFSFYHDFFHALYISMVVKSLSL